MTPAPVIAPKLPWWERLLVSIEKIASAAETVAQTVGPIAIKVLPLIDVAANAFIKDPASKAAAATVEGDINSALATATVTTTTTTIKPTTEAK